MKYFADDQALAGLLFLMFTYIFCFIVFWAIVSANNNARKVVMHEIILQLKREGDTFTCTIKPCPECGADINGGRLNVSWGGLWHDHYERTQIRCSDCDFTLKGLGLRRIIALWNSLDPPEVCQKDLALAWVAPDKERTEYYGSLEAEIYNSCLAAEAEHYRETIEETLKYREECAEEKRIEADRQITQEYLNK